MENCLPILENALIALAKVAQFELVVVADVEPTFSWAGVQVRYIPWTPETEVESLHLMDIGLMPLKDDEFQRGKCGAKAITYMAVGIPAVVSPVGVNIEIVTPGINGYHCATDEDWICSLRKLIQQEALRIEMGQSAREAVVLRYSIKSLLPRMIKAFSTPHS
jgi:glycosyltransferase involved in cell wall biosynthesis